VIDVGEPQPDEESFCAPTYMLNDESIQSTAIGLNIAFLTNQND
jgi:hypothetical protein